MEPEKTFIYFLGERYEPSIVDINESHTVLVYNKLNAQSRVSPDSPPYPAGPAGSPYSVGPVNSVDSAYSVDLC